MNISNSTANTTVTGSSGNDSISNEYTATRAAIYSGDGNDTIFNQADKVTIMSGNGNDSIHNNGGYTSIVSGDGNDTIDNNSSLVSINGGAGDDSIRHRMTDSSINGGEGNDRILSDWVRNILVGGKGDDTITLGKSTVSGNGQLIKYAQGDGTDVITGLTKYDTVNITSGTISNVNVSGNDVTVTIGTGSLTLKNAKNVPFHVKLADGSTTLIANDSATFNGTNSTTFSGSSSSNYLINDGASVTMTGGSGNDTLVTRGQNSVINASSGNDSIAVEYAYDSTAYVSVNASSGDNSIFSSGRYNTITAGSGNDYLYNLSAHSRVNLGDGDNRIYNDHFDYFSVIVGSGDDSIHNSTNSHITVSSGAGNDTISGIHYVSKIDLGDGNDYFHGIISRSTVEAGEGNDTITGSSDNSKIDMGAGNDYFSSNLSSSSINGGSGNDSIMIIAQGINCTLEGGKGDDTIGLYKNGSYASTALIKYSYGDGNDVITSYDSNSTIRLGGGKYQTLQGSDGFTIQVGTGSILLKDYTASANKPVYITGGTLTSGDSAEATVDSASVVGSDGDDTLYSNGKSQLKFTGGKGNDLIILDKGYGYKGNSHRINYSIGDGNDTIIGFDETDFISLNDATTYKAKTKGNDVILTVGDGSIIVKDARGKKITIWDKDRNIDRKVFTGTDTIDAITNDIFTVVSGSDKGDYIVNAQYFATIAPGAGNDTIHNYDFIGNAIIIAGEDNDQIYTQGEATINGGKGNDTIDLESDWPNAADHANLIQFTKGDGNDVVLGYREGDTIQITENASFTTTRSGNDIIISVSGGNLTIKDFSGMPNIVKTKQRSVELPDGIIRNYDDDVVVSGTSGVDTIYNYGLNDTINAGTGNDSVHNFEDAENAVINTGGGDDSIRNDAYYATINVGEGNDSIHNYYAYYCSIFAGAGNDTILNTIGRYSMIDLGEGNDSIRNDANHATVYSGAGNDTIFNRSGQFVSINGGAGDDSIKVDYNYSSGWSGRHNTINGGAGNDTIILNNSSHTRYDVIQYANGDGKDIITGINYTDSISFIDDDTKYETLTSGNDIIVSVGSGSMTFKNAKGSKLNFLNGIYDGVNTIDNPKSRVLVNGSSARDSVHNTGHYDTITTSDSNDTIYNIGEYATIYSGEGNDYINSTGSNGHYYGGTGDDTFSVSSDIYQYNKFFYSEGDGNDVIQGHSWNDTLYITSGTIGNVTGSGNDLTIQVGTGSIKVVGAKNQPVFVADRFNNLSGYLWNGSIVKNIIFNGSNKSSVNGTENADYIYNKGENSTIVGGKGDDTITFSEHNSFIKYDEGDGNDIINNYESTDAVYITYGTEYSTGTSGQDVIITVGSSSSQGTIILKEAKDKQININARYIPTVTAGFTYKANEKLLIVTDGFKPKTLESSDYKNTVETIDGSDRSKALYINGNDNDNFIKGGKGNDTLTGGNGRDVFIYNINKGNDVIADYKTNEDSIAIQGGIVSKAILKKNDVVLTIGKNTLTIKDGKNAIINVSDSTGSMLLANDGKNIHQIINNYFDNTLISGSAINDSINDFGYYNTVVAGTGDDTVSLVSNSTVIRYSNGDGKDVILTPTAGSTTSLIPSTYLVDLTNGTAKLKRATKKNPDPVLTIGSGSLTFKDFDSSNSIVVKGKNAVYTRYYKGKTFTDLNKGNELANAIDGAIINGSKKDEFAVISGNNITLNGAKGADYLVGNGTEYSVINAGAGKDTIIAIYNNNSTLNGGTDNDYIYVTNDNHSTINGGKGNDTIEFGDITESGTTVEYIEGHGKDVFVNYNSDVTIVLTSDEMEIKKTKTNKKGDVILSVTGGTLTFKNHAGQAIAIADSRGNTTSAVYDNNMVNITGTNESDYLIGTATHDSIVGLAGDDTLEGNAGNDTITGGDGNDLFIYNDGDGKDIITDYAVGDEIEINDEAIKSIARGKRTAANDLILKIGKGTLTLKDAATKKIKLTDEEGYTSAQVYGDTITTILDGDGEVINTTLNTTVLTIDANARTYDVDLVGNKKNNTIISGTGDDTLTGGGGNDVFVHNAGNDLITDYTVGKDALKFNASIVSAEVDGDDVVFNLGTAGIVTVIDAKDKDLTVIDENNQTTTAVYPNTTIIITNKSADTVTAASTTIEMDATQRTSKAVTIIANDLDNTITGGKKNDTITGGAGADTFIYNKACGKDVITDYASSDTDIIKLGDGAYITDATISGNDKVLTLNSGSLTLKNTASQDVTVIDANGNEIIYPATTAAAAFEERWFSEDNNFTNSDLENILDDKTANIAVDYKFINEESIVKSSKQLPLTHNKQ